MGRGPDAPLAGPSYRCFRRARRPRRAAASSRPGGRESRRRRSAACEGVFFSNQKNTPSRFPRKIVRGDGVVTSSISLAAARRAPAPSFRCSSFSHRKTLRWEPCDFPPDAPLKRPKEGLRPFLWKPSRGYGGWEVAARRGMRDAGALLRALRRALGRGTGCLRSFRALRLAGDEADDSPVDVEPALGAFIAPALCVFPVFL